MMYTVMLVTPAPVGLDNLHVIVYSRYVFKWIPIHSHPDR